MSPPGYNEADTRAKLIDPALHARQWIEFVKEEQRTTHVEIHREQSAVRIDILYGKPLKRGRGRVDYLLRTHVAEHEQPLTLAFVEAKKEKLPPTQGLEQVKEYARRHAVKFVYSTNGHLFVEYDTTTGKTGDPQPIAQFRTPDELRSRWFASTRPHPKSAPCSPPTAWPATSCATTGNASGAWARPRGCARCDPETGRGMRRDGQGCR